MKMRAIDRLLSILVLTIPMLSLGGCSLAQPEKGATKQLEDRFAGVYMVYYEENEKRDFFENEHLTQYGEDAVTLGKYGTHAFPREVLFARADDTFPGLEGYALYELRVINEVEKSYRLVNTGMCHGGTNVHITDEENKTEFSGTIYMGLPAGAVEDERDDKDGVWVAYRVFQTEDGRAYLDGSGNSFQGPMTTTETVSQTISVNGETETETVTVKVSVEEAPQLEAASVLQYGVDGGCIDRIPVPLTDDAPVVTWLDGAMWAVIEEETSAGVQRTFYDRPDESDEPVTHSLILLDERGLGQIIPLALT